MPFVQITTTAGDAAVAQKIADHLVSHRLAGCVQVLGPMASTYWWDGSVQRSEEFMCIIKTRSELSEQVESAICAMHPYENPEVVVLPIEGGSPDYLGWIAEETDKGA